MSEQEKWQEARAAWQEYKRGLITLDDFNGIVGDLCQCKDA